MSPSKQRRVERRRIQAADLGMSLEQWRAWRAWESVDRAAREKHTRQIGRAFDLRDREMRRQMGRSTTMDHVEVYTETAVEGLRRAFERHLLYGAALRSPPIFSDAAYATSGARRE